MLGTLDLLTGGEPARNPGERLAAPFVATERGEPAFRGRQLYGWRGRTALRWTLSGFVLLFLAYIGSRFVIEVILGRT